MAAGDVWGNSWLASWGVSWDQSAVVVPPVIPPVVSSGTGGGGGGGFRLHRERRTPRRKSLAEVVDLAVQDVVAELRKASEPVVEQMQAIVAPHVVKPTPRSRPRIDYEALERDVVAVRELVQLLEDERSRAADDEEEEELAIYAAL